MPAAAPPISIELANVLATAGVRLRMHRKSIQIDLARAIERLRGQPHCLVQCMTALGMRQVPYAVV